MNITKHHFFANSINMHALLFPFTDRISIKYAQILANLIISLPPPNSARKMRVVIATIYIDEFLSRGCCWIFINDKHWCYSKRCTWLFAGSICDMPFWTNICSWGYPTSECIHCFVCHGCYKSEWKTIRLVCWRCDIYAVSKGKWTKHSPSATLLFSR